MSNGMGFGADDAQDGSYGGDFGGGDQQSDWSSIVDAMRGLFGTRALRGHSPTNVGYGPPQGWGAYAQVGPRGWGNVDAMTSAYDPRSPGSPVDPMSGGLGRRGIAPPNWGGFDTQQAYGNFKGLNPNWGDWDNQQANVGALKGFGPWSNVTSPFEPMSGGNISRGYREPDYNEGGW